MKHLKVEYTTDSGNGIVLWDAEVNEVVWTDGPNGIRVDGKTGTGGGGMGGLLDLLTGASKARTEAVVGEKRASLAGAAPAEHVAETDPA
jgi:hypothetical protein